MKPLLLSLVAGSFILSGSAEREVQADFVTASLIKIDTTTRYPNVQQKILTWQGANHVLYITYEHIETIVSIGTTRQVLVRR
ncbi:MAG TPA: hypothetical protein VMR70_04355 [Flavisolibacter sp.]|nr:hypothetical protein [Flavisolibacter sp.]